jgi:hypothetical protein
VVRRATNLIQAPNPEIPTGSANRLDKVWMVTKDVLASLIISAGGWVS